MVNILMLHRVLPWCKNHRHVNADKILLTYFTHSIFLLFAVGHTHPPFRDCHLASIVIWVEWLPGEIESLKICGLA